MEMTTHHIHCDDYMDDKRLRAAQPECLIKFLEHARAPAHGHLLPKPWPKLFANYKGKRVRVTMASRMGDVGITYDLNQSTGYKERCFVEHLSDFSDQT